MEFSSQAAREEALDLDGCYIAKRFVKVSLPLVPRVEQALAQVSVLPSQPLITEHTSRVDLCSAENQITHCFTFNLFL